MQGAQTLFKALGDDTRLRILRMLDGREMYIELLSERLKLSPATVSFHMKKLSEANLVSSRREQYYRLYTINKEVFDMTIGEAALANEAAGNTEEEKREEAYRNKVIKSFMPLGYCEVLPAQYKKKLIIYEEIFKQFTPGATLPEKEVNDIISRVHNDFCLIRREFVEMGWMSRDRKGIYTVNERVQGTET